MKKTFTIAATVILGVLATTFPTHAQTADKDAKKIQRLFTKLNKNVNSQTRPAPVIRLARKLVKLDPKDAKRYYKTGVLKFVAIFAERKSAYLQSIFDRQLDKAQKSKRISRKQNKLLQRQIARIQSRVIQQNAPTPTPTPFPTPTPYQASVGEMHWIFG